MTNRISSISIKDRTSYHSLLGTVTGHSWRDIQK